MVDTQSSRYATCGQPQFLNACLILMKQDTDKTSATPGKQLKQNETEHDISVSHGRLSLGELLPNPEQQEDFSTTRERVESQEGYAGVDRDDDELFTTASPSMHARLTEAIDPHPKNEHPASYDEAPEQTVPQHPATQLPGIQHPAIQHSAPSILETPSPPHQNPSSTSQSPPSEPVQNTQEQSRQIHRILSCPTDAYFDILSLANGTDLPPLIRASKIELSYLLHSIVCPHPDADLALSRVNGAYAWIQEHPGLSQPYVPSPTMPPVTQDTPSTSRASPAASSLEKDTVRESQQPSDSPGTEPDITTQQPGSGTTHIHEMPPPTTFGPRPSSEIYVINGEPTVRPSVGWQFREFEGETRVWYNGRWRKLIQNRPEFRGLRVDEHGWIMPVLDRTLSWRNQKHVRAQARFEFNSHT